MDFDVDSKSASLQKIPTQRTLNSSSRQTRKLTERCADQTWPSQSVDVAGFNFVVTDLASATQGILHMARERKGISIRLGNAYSLALTRNMDGYRDLYLGSGINLPDGTPVAWTMKLKCRGEFQPQKVRGPSLFTSLIAATEETGLSHFLLGGSEECLELLLWRIQTEHPSVALAGSLSPPFQDPTPKDLDAWATKITASGADIVWIGLGTPKQDFVAVALAERLGVPCIGIGAAFNFYAGLQPEAPRWVQRCGIEWMFRLACEPRRLWKRYLLGNLEFLFIVITKWKV